VNAHDCLKSTLHYYQVELLLEVPFIPWTIRDSTALIDSDNRRNGNRRIYADIKRCLMRFVAEQGARVETHLKEG